MYAYFHCKHSIIAVVIVSALRTSLLLERARIQVGYCKVRELQTHCQGLRSGVPNQATMVATDCGQQCVKEARGVQGSANHFSKKDLRGRKEESIRSFSTKDMHIESGVRR